MGAAEPSPRAEPSPWAELFPRAELNALTVPGPSDESLRRVQLEALSQLISLGFGVGSLEKLLGFPP